MSFNEVLKELPALTVEQRQVLISRALELDELPLSAEDEILVEQRLADHRRNPASSVPLAEMKDRLRSRFPK
ncbi:MAG: hypothetical protein LV481_15355 [Methylacidiphilales bacterium]|nr:hypothetical protein [Candidatus Methylacidiphilales bacterium]